MKRTFACLFWVGLALGCHSSAEPAGVSIEVEGQVADVDLRKVNVYADTFKAYTLTNGVLVPNKIQPKTDCYYAANLDFNGLKGVAALQNCAGVWQGTLMTDDGHGYELTTRSNRLVATRLPDKAGACGTGHGNPQTLPAATSTRKLALGGTRFVEMLVFRDQAMLSRSNEGPDPVTTVHIAAALYDGTQFVDNVVPVITGQIDAPDDPWGTPNFFANEADADQLLDIFNVWLEANRSQLPAFDQATLMTGFDMTGATVGYANVEGACTTDTAGAIIEGIGPDPAIGQTFAHELGHTLGMNHDGFLNGCDRNAFVMTAIYDEDGPYPTGFSNCSITDANQFLSRPASSCINQQTEPTVGDAFCGDGVVEGDEQCDCGPDGCDGRDPCCNASTCRYAAGATCASDDGCCDLNRCAPFAAADNVTCRDALDSCDIAEVCDGRASCPPNIVVPTGTECTDESGWDGRCYVGRCRTRGGVCEEIAPLYFFDDPPYDPMCAIDVECGNMECLANDACVFLTDFFTPDGIECAPGRQCLDGQCVDSATLPAADGCANPPCVSAPPDMGVEEPDMGMPDADQPNDSGPTDNSTDTGSPVSSPNSGASASSCSHVSTRPNMPPFDLIFIVMIGGIIRWTARSFGLPKMRRFCRLFSVKKLP